MMTNMEKPYVVGIDIGGTNTVFGIVDARGNKHSIGTTQGPASAQSRECVEAASTSIPRRPE